MSEIDAEPIVAVPPPPRGRPPGLQAPESLVEAFVRDAFAAARARGGYRPGAWGIAKRVRCEGFVVGDDRVRIAIERLAAEGRLPELPRRLDKGLCVSRGRCKLTPAEAAAAMAAAAGAVAAGRTVDEATRELIRGLLRIEKGLKAWRCKYLEEHPRCD